MKFQKTLFALAFACSPAVFAATSGDLAATSTGSADVSVTVGDLVQVTVQNDISMGAATAGSDSTGSAGLCIYRNGTGSVNLTLTSANDDGGAFQMLSGTDLLEYSVALSGDDAVASVTSGTANALTSANTSSSSCGGNFGHDIDVTVNSADVDAAAAGSYTDTITILVEPV